MTVEKLVQSLSLEVLSLEDGKREIAGGYCGDLLSWVMGKAKSGNAWITIMNNLNVIAVASMTDVSCVIFAENSEVDEQIVQKGREQGINLLRSGLDAYTLCARIYNLCHE